MDNEDDLTRIKEIEIELNQIARRNNFLYEINTNTVGDLIHGNMTEINIDVYKKLM